jgi:GntR family transcriptional regulator, vanillate catabolism transcriptional regulator
MDSQQTRALVKMREMILRRELRPGQRVAEAAIAERLGMSRTPVRQALPVLAQEGLLADHPTRGYVVRSFSAADILDAIDLRGTIEGLAVRRVAEQGASPTLIDVLKQCLEEGDRILRKGHVEEHDEGPYADMNARFHTLIMSEARSPMITQALERIGHIPFAGPQALAFDKKSLERMYAVMLYAHYQHHSIVAAIERGEAARAEALMREHANTPKESLNLLELETNQRSLAQVPLVSGN